MYPELSAHLDTHFLIFFIRAPRGISWRCEAAVFVHSFAWRSEYSARRDLVVPSTKLRVTHAFTRKKTPDLAEYLCYPLVN